MATYLVKNEGSRTRYRELLSSLERMAYKSDSSVSTTAISAETQSLLVQSIRTYRCVTREHAITQLGN